MEAIVATIINTYGTQIWLSFIGLIATTFIMSIIKNFISDLVLFYKIRMSDLGKGAMIIWNNKLKMVKKIHFRHIEVYDDQEVVYIPTRKWFNSDQIYPKPKDIQFKENNNG